MMSQEITAYAVELKSLIQRSMSAKDLEQATRCCNGIIAEAEIVAGLEGQALKQAGGPSARPKLEACQ